MAKNSDFASYCNDLFGDHNDLINFDNNSSHASSMEPLVYYDLKPVSETVNKSSLCNMQSSSRLAVSAMDLNMDVIGDEHLKNKRKGSIQCSDYEDDNNEESRSVRNDDNKKHNHSEIEKRRRDKMNTYITELASMIPMCHNMSRKLDKLTVLRMAVQHMKSIRGTVNSYTEGHYKLPFVSDQVLNKLITQAAEGFVFAVSCDHGKILYISKSVTQVLNYLPEDLVGNSVFDYIHPKDVAKVKEQLSCSDLGPRDRYIDAKTMLPVCEDMISTLPKMCSGARRSFFCRMKCKIYSVKEEADTNAGTKYTQSDSSSVKSKSSFKSSDMNGSSQKCRDKRYSVIQCTGYLKPRTQMNDCDDLSGMSLEQGDNKDGLAPDSDSANNISCLIAVGRINNTSASGSILSDIVKPPYFTSKHTIDGKFLSVDQRVTYIVGFLPQELLGTSMYEYFHQDDISGLVETHKATLQECKPTNTETYRFRTKDKTYVYVRSEWKTFRNPWTKDIEFIVAKNILTRPDPKPDSSNKSECSSQNHRDIIMNEELSRKKQQLGNKEMQNVITSHLEASKIGRNIVDTVLEEKKKSCDTDSLSCTRHNKKTETSNNNDGLSFLRSPFVVLNDPGASSSSPNSNSPYTAMIPDSGDRANVNRLGSTNANGTADNAPNNAPLPTPSLIYSNSGLTMSGDSGDLLGDIMEPSSQQLSGTDPNDETAMAVIMSLLEADAGLGGPVDFLGLPWSLP